MLFLLIFIIPKRKSKKETRDKRPIDDNKINQKKDWALTAILLLSDDVKSIFLSFFNLS